MDAVQSSTSESSSSSSDDSSSDASEAMDAVTKRLNMPRGKRGGMTGCSRLEVYCSYPLLQSLLGLPENLNG